MSYSSEVLADSPSVYYRLGENAGATTLVDSSSSGLNGTPASNGYLTNSTPGVQGVLGGDSDKAVRVVISGQIRTDDATAVLTARSGFTAEAWTIPTAAAITAFRTLCGQQSAWSMGVSSSGSGLRFTTVAIQDFETASFTWRAGIRTHLVVVFDSAFDASFYVNGAFVAKVLGAAQTNAPTSSFWIGSQSNSGGSHWDGIIDEVAVYQSELSAERIAIHYAVGNAFYQQAPATYPASKFGPF